MSNSDLLFFISIQGLVTENRIYYSYFRDKFTVGNLMSHGIFSRAEEIDSQMKCLSNCACLGSSWWSCSLWDCITLVPV